MLDFLGLCVVSDLSLLLFGADTSMLLFVVGGEVALILAAWMLLSGLDRCGV